MRETTHRRHLLFIHQILIGLGVLTLVRLNNKLATRRALFKQSRDADAARPDHLLSTSPRLLSLTVT